MKQWKQTHSPQYDGINQNTGNEEYGYDKAEEQRQQILEKHREDYHKIWHNEGLE